MQLRRGLSVRPGPCEELEGFAGTFLGQLQLPGGAEEPGFVGMELVAPNNTTLPVLRVFFAAYGPDGLK